MRPIVIAKALVLVLLGIYLALGLSAAPQHTCAAEFHRPRANSMR